MKIIHQIGTSWTIDQVDQLSKHGIYIKSVGEFSYVTLQEDIYLKLEETIKEWKVIHVIGTEYTKQELDNSQLLVLNGIREHGYPQPDSDFLYIKATYNIDDYCPKCGCGAIQKGPFYIKKEFPWTKSCMYQLIWVYDEIFAEKSFYNNVLKPLGIDSRPVLFHKTKLECPTTVQLKIPVRDDALDLSSFNYEYCDKCHRKKYSPKVIGFHPGYKNKIDVPLFKSSEYFGSGGMAFNHLFITQQLRRLLIFNKIIKENQCYVVDNK